MQQHVITPALWIVSRWYACRKVGGGPWREGSRHNRLRHVVNHHHPTYHGFHIPQPAPLGRHGFLLVLLTQQSCSPLRTFELFLPSLQSSPFIQTSPGLSVHFFEVHAQMSVYQWGFPIIPSPVIVSSLQGTFPAPSSPLFPFIFSHTWPKTLTC